MNLNHFETGDDKFDVVVDLAMPDFLSSEHIQIARML